MRIATLAAILPALVSALPAMAAVIGWGGPQAITNDSDVLQVGQFLDATQTHGETVTDQTIGDATFTHAAGRYSASSPDGHAFYGASVNGYFQWDADASQSEPVPPEASLAYQAVMSQAVYMNPASSAQINLSNLTVAHDYALQVWVNQGDPNNVTSFSTADGPSVALAPTGNAVNGLGQYVVGSFQADATGQQIDFTSPAYPILNALQLRDVTGVWSGATNGTWDNSTPNFTGGNNFSAVAGLVSSVYFADTDGFGKLVTSNTVNVAAGGVQTGIIYFQNNALNYTLTSSDTAGIAGSTAVYVLGGGAVTLLGTHTYTGGTTIGRSSTLNIGNGATDGSLANSAIQNNGSLVFSPATSVTYGNSISGTGTLTKSGAGTLILTAPNSYTGATTIDNGTIRAGNYSIPAGAPLTINANGVLVATADNSTGDQNAAAPLIIHGGSLDTNGTYTYFNSLAMTAGHVTTAADRFILAIHPANSEDVVINPTATATIDNLVLDGRWGIPALRNVAVVDVASDPASGPGLLVTGSVSDSTNHGWGGSSMGLVKTGTGTMVLAGQNSYSGDTVVNAGRLVVHNSTQFTTNVQIAAGGMFVAYPTADWTNGGNMTISGSGTLVKYGPNNWWLGYEGGHVAIEMAPGGLIDVEGGILQNNWARNSWVNNQASMNVAPGAVFDMYAEDVPLGGLNGAGTVRNGFPGFGVKTLTIGVTDASGDFSGSIAGGGGDVALLKLGAGTQILSGTNTYMGGTVVDAGTLILASSRALADGSSLTVGAGAATIFGLSAARTPLTASATAVATVPEPGTLALLGVAGIVAAAVWQGRRKVRGV